MSGEEFDESNTSLSRNWRKGRRRNENSQFRWQKRQASDTQNAYFGSKNVSIFATILGLATLFGLAMFLWILFAAPRRTEFLIIAPTNYYHPLPPIAWTVEDTNSIEALNRETINVQNGSPAFEYRENWDTRFTNDLQNLANSRAECLVIVFRMHGAVNEDLIPCLIPPEYSDVQSQDQRGWILASKNWIPISEIFEQLKSPSLNKKNKLLVFDCNQQLENWDLGVFENRFFSRLEEAFKKSELPNTAILTANRDHECNWSSETLRHSVFGHYLAKGLAGEADDPQMNFGNGDYLISLKELSEYVRQKALKWTCRNRGKSQSPMLLLGDLTGDVVIASRPNKWTQKELSRPSRAVPQTVTEQQLDKLWSDMDALQSAHPLTYSPFQWESMRQELIHLEKLSRSGAAYLDIAKRRYINLAIKTQSSRKKLSKLEGTHPSIFDRWNVLANRPFRSPAELHLHDVSLGQYLGAISETVAGTIRPVIQRLAAEWSETDANKLLADFNNKRTDTYSIIALLEFMNRYRTRSLWRTNPDVLADLIRCHDLADRLAVPNVIKGEFIDQRAHALVRPWLDKLDESRRITQDLLASTNPADIQTVRDQLNELLEDYAKIEATLLKASEIFQVTDEAKVNLSYFAQWSVSPIRSGEIFTEIAGDSYASRAIDPIAVQKDLEELLQRFEIETAISESISNSEVNPARFSDLFQYAEIFQNSYSELQESFKDCLKNQLEADPTASTLCELLALLEMPLLNNFERREARTKCQLISESLSNHSESAEETHSLRMDVTSDTSNKHRSEVLKIFVDDLLPNNEQLSEQTRGASLREYLLSLLANKAAEIGQKRSIEAIRQTLSERVRTLRSVARFYSPNIYSPSTTPSQDPVRSLQTIDLSQLLIWHAHRTQSDFWGNFGHLKHPFYLTSSQDQIDAAKSVLRIKFAEVLNQVVWPTQLEESFLFKTIPNQRVTYAQGNVASLNVKVSSSSKSLTRTGRVALIIRNSVDNTRPIDGIEIRRAGSQLQLQNTLEIPAESENVLFHLTTQKPTDRFGNYEAVGVFRGHETTSQFVVQNVGGVTTTFVPNTAPSEVVVLRSLPKIPSVVVVVDGSHSMSFEVPTEATQGKSISLLDRSRGLVSLLLSRLSENKETRLGVRFFGHRVGWSVDQPNKVLRQNNYIEPIPDSKSPSDDVELVLPLGRYDEFAAAKVQSRLKSIAPWGQTPLYLAIVEALKDFDTDSKDTVKSIVVFSDGANYQFNPGVLNDSTVTPTSAAEVINAWKTHPDTTIYFVAMGLETIPANLADTEIGVILNQTRGKFFTENEFAELIGQLEKPSTMNKYSITHDGKTESEPLDLTVPYRPDPSELPLGLNINVQSLSQDVILEGGEALAFEPSTNGDYLRLNDDEINVIENAFLTKPDGLASGTRVGLFQPYLNGEKANFQIVFYDAVFRYLPKPKEIWIEITPLRDGKPASPTPFLFFDRDFSPKKAFPTLLCSVNRWPEGANAAAVHVWASDQRTASTATVTQKEIEDSKQPLFEKEIEGIKCRLNFGPDSDNDQLNRVDVIEYHGANESSPSALRVETSSESIAQPLEIIRQYDHQNRVVMHTFFFRKSDFDNGNNNFQIDFTTRKAILAASDRILDPAGIRTSVNALDDVIQSTPQN
ncbi:MAG: hypothetical protein CBC13_01975 [Planctomycetia bacterium TMED53]|nr:MAG: hypothetical protein CBC13_01975 [Planctomycetia bacterium TMED53]